MCTSPTGQRAPARLLGPPGQHPDRDGDGQNDADQGDGQGRIHGAYSPSSPLP